MRIGFIIMAVFLALTDMVHAEVVDVLIKGVDDGVKSNKQQDYQEAVMNAKLQAIERAGVKVESTTQVVNFQMQYKAVESKAKAVLLPGFQIMDLGYLPDGTYQVVLSGRVTVGDQKSQNRELARDGFFILYENRVVKDAITGLEWVAGPDKDMRWDQAKSWVKSLKLAGGGWRMPTMDELAALYKKGAGDRNMTPLLRNTGWYVWSGETDGFSIASSFDFNFGSRDCPNRNLSRNSRAFAVRSRSDG